MSHFEELLAKYNKTMEDITFEFDGMSDEELDVKFAELFDETDTETVESENVEDEDTETTETEADSEVSEESDGEQAEFEADEVSTFTRTYELSHDDIRCALYNLLIPYEEADGKYYYITKVYDGYFVYEAWCEDVVYGQAYVKDEETVSFDGERYELFKELLTASEKAELEAMRSNYSAISEKLKAYEDAELETKKTELLNSDDYSQIRENADFAKLIKDHENIGYEELMLKCDSILLDAVKTGKYSIPDAEKHTTSKKQFVNPVNDEKKSSRYGRIFEKEEK